MQSKSRSLIFPRALIGSLLALGLLAAGCGSDDDGSADEPTTTEANAATTNAATTSDASAPPTDMSTATVADGDVPERDGEEVKLGFINPSTGSFASIGTDFQRAMDLYLSQHDNLLGGYTVDVVTVDEGAGAAEAIPGARKLIEQDDVDLVTGLVSSASAGAVFPLFEQAEIPVIGLQGYPYADVKTEDVSPYLWNAGGSNPPFSGSMARHLAETVDPESGVYFVTSDYVGGRTLLDEVMAAYEDAGGHVAGTAYPPLGTTLDFQPYLSQIEESGATSVYAFFAGADAVRFVQQYAEFGLSDDIQLYSTSGLVTVANLEAIGDAAEGIITNGYYTAALENTENDQFVADFMAEYGVRPDNYEARMWDTMTFMDEALSKVDTLSPEAIVEALKSVDTFLSPRGTWKMDPVTHVAIVPMNLWRVVKGPDGLQNEFLEELGTFDPASGLPVS